MTELPLEWTANEYWDFNDSGAQSYVYALTSGPYSASETAIMDSDHLIVPSSVDSIIVHITDDWDWSGWCTTGESNCSIWFRLVVVGGGYYTIEFDSHHWGFDESENGSSSASVLVPISGDTEFYLSFYSYAGSSYGAMAEMEWNIYDLMITDTGGTSLARSTWGSIKSCFESNDQLIFR